MSDREETPETVTAITVAINDPLAVLVVNLDVLSEKLATADEETQSTLRDIGESVERIRAIMKRVHVQLATSARKEPLAPPQPQRQRMRILAIDDEPTIGTAIARALREHDVVPLTDAREALARITRGEVFDVVLCDLMMPAMSGMDFYAELARVAPAFVEKVVFVTAGAVTAQARELLKTAPNVVIEKPFDVERLRAVIAARQVPVEAPRVVLVVDDDDAVRRLVVRQLTDAGFRCMERSTGDVAVRDLIAQPDLAAVVVLDVMMPGLNGFDVIAKLRENGATASLPVILLTAQAVDANDVAYGIEAGAMFYLTKPVPRAVLVANVRAACERADAARDMRERLHDAEENATTDALTTLMNRRAFEVRLAENTANATRYEEPLALVMLDIDHFKAVNDAHGHGGGDRVLAHFGAALRRAVRAGDQAFRYGGEEFALLLPRCDVAGAHRVAARLQEELRAHAIQLDTGSMTIRFSAGIAMSDKANGFRTSDLVTRADAALYRAKSEGRDRIVIE